MNKKGIKVEFLGRSASEVTQSCYKVSCSECTILLDYGLYQGANILDTYRVNHEKMKGLRPKDIDFILISHANIDHCGALPWLFAHGCTAKVYIPRGNRDLIFTMLYDSAKIMLSDSLKLSKHNMNSTPLYDENDIKKLESFVEEIDFGKVVKLTDNVSFKMISAGHIVNSSQIVLYYDEGELVKRIVYTGDIGSPVIERPYVAKYEYPEYADLLIGECTYSSGLRVDKASDRAKDIEKIKAIVQSTCIDNKSRVLLPVFSMDRLQTILTVLYQIYGDDPCFRVPVVIDTPLGAKVTKLWDSIIYKDQMLWQKVIGWRNIVMLDLWDDSMAFQASNQPCIVLASSGMCTNGRSVAWCKRLLPDEKAHICFCGYSADGSLAQRIKDGKKNKYIEIEESYVPNRCGVTSLFSFSSHACRNDLLDLYGEKLNYGTLCLVHSEMESKKEFAVAVKDRLADSGRSSKVVAVQTGYSICI